MSQSGSLSGGTGPTVPTTFTADVGTAHPAAGNINFFTNYNSDDTNAGIETTASGDTISIEMTNRLAGMGTTIDTSSVNLVNFTLAGSATDYIFNFNLVGYDSVSDIGLGYTVICPARTDGLTSTVIGSPLIFGNVDAALLGVAVAFTASGNDVILSVTGVAGETISFKTVCTFTVV